jgi:putative ABC transport system substrate-binding protein
VRARSRATWICVLAAACGWWPLASAQAADVLVVRSKASPRAAKLYNQAIEALRVTYDTPVDVIAMEGELADTSALLEAIRQAKPKVIVAVGPKAAKVIRQNIAEVPIVFCMVSHAIQLSLKNTNSTGVTMQPTPGQQIEAFRRVIPGMRHIGVIFHPDLSGSFVAEARQAAGDLGLRLVERPVTTNREVPNALKEIIEQADGLWLLRDGKVVTQEFFTQTLLLQAERKLPLMVFSDRFVEKGALCSYSAGYDDQGRQAARIAKRIVSGTPVRDIPIQAPEGILTINLASAARLGIQISPEVLKRPDVRAVGRK